MSHESFEDKNVAEFLNQYFVSVKVDREERPDIDGVYMRACQAMTGGGGWPTSIFMNADGKPFFAGTYYPKESFLQVLDAIAQTWQKDRALLLEQGGRLVAAIKSNIEKSEKRDTVPFDEAVYAFRSNFDPEYGGFGPPPKFPSAHNLMFLLHAAPELAEKTLECMYRGGIFDHVGGGFSRYSTDREWLVPHFEKMLYDNALLAMAYLEGFGKKRSMLYRNVAERIFAYLERELRDMDGGFFSAQDADSEGVEGKFYVFSPDELIALLGEEDGVRFCQKYGISNKGNFEGKCIPNLLHSLEMGHDVDVLIPQVYEYRKKRTPPNTDSKKLCAWNALTAAAYAMAGRILQNKKYLDTARETVAFIERELIKDDVIFVGVTDGERAGPGFLDDYAFYIFALIQLYQASLEDWYLDRASKLTDRTYELFWDKLDSGFFFSGSENEILISRTKESWDGAMPSGNSVMAYNLSRLALLQDEERYIERDISQRRFMNGKAVEYPMGYGFYLWSTLPVKKVVCAPAVPDDLKIPSDWVVRAANSSEYPVINGKTTYYICENGVCYPPINELNA